MHDMSMVLILWSAQQHHFTGASKLLDREMQKAGDESTQTSALVTCPLHVPCQLHFSEGHDKARDSVTGEVMRWGLHTLRSAPLPPRDPTRASATEGPLPGAKAGCHLPQAVSEAAMSDSACKHSDVSPAGPQTSREENCYIFALSWQCSCPMRSSMWISAMQKVARAKSCKGWHL